MEFIVRDEHRKGSGIPQGIKIELTLLDPNAESGETATGLPTARRSGRSEYESV